MLSPPKWMFPSLIPFAAGNFPYIGASDLVPEVMKHRDPGVNIINFIFFLFGVSLMLLIKVVLGS